MARARIPVTVVTGTFGSGKSTTVRRLVDLAAARGEQVAVVSASLSPPGSRCAIEVI